MKTPTKTAKTPPADYKAQQFKKLGATVVDAMTLLEHGSRMQIQNAALTRQEVHIHELQKGAMLTAAHALQSVLEALNEECVHYERLTLPRRSTFQTDVSDL